MDCFVANAPRNDEKGKRNAERRSCVTSAPCDAARPPPSSSPRAGEDTGGGRSPLGVPPRHLRQRPNATAQLEPRDFPGQARSARPDGSKDARIATHDAKPTDGLPCVTRGHYPRLAVPAQRDCTRRPVMMPAGRVLPKPPESRGDEPRPAGTALAPPAGVTRLASWYVSEIRGFVPHSGTNCQADCPFIRYVRLCAVTLRCERSDPRRVLDTAPPPCVIRGSTRSLSSGRPLRAGPVGVEHPA